MCHCSLLNRQLSRSFVPDSPNPTTSSMSSAVGMSPSEVAGASAADASASAAAGPSSSSSSSWSVKHHHHHHPPHGGGHQQSHGHPHQHQGHPGHQEHHQLSSSDVSRQLQSIYGEHFPIEVRHVLSGWLEHTFSEDLDTAANPQHEEHARALVVSLVQQLEAKAAAETSDFVLKSKLDQIIDNFKVREHRELNSQFSFIPFRAGARLPDQSSLRA